VVNDLPSYLHPKPLAQPAAVLLLLLLVQHLLQGSISS
jgi:hypothetical protein